MLRAFWRDLDAGGHALDLLTRYALERPAIRPPRDPHAVRREHLRQRATTPWRGKRCISCNELATQEHHIIQIQYGGTNRPQNKVWVCTDCHRAIHPCLRLPATDLPVGSVPTISGTEQLGTCPACYRQVLSVLPKIKKGRAVGSSLRPILLIPTAKPPYTTDHLHINSGCMNRKGLSRLAHNDMAVLARTDGTPKPHPAQHWNTQNIARAVEVLRG